MNSLFPSSLCRLVQLFLALSGYCFLFVQEAHPISPLPVLKVTFCMFVWCFFNRIAKENAGLVFYFLFLSYQKAGQDFQSHPSIRCVMHIFPFFLDNSHIRRQNSFLLFRNVLKLWMFSLNFIIRFVHSSNIHFVQTFFPLSWFFSNQIQNFWCFFFIPKLVKGF